MATALSSRSTPALALECGPSARLATPALLGWRERLLQAVNTLRWWRASPTGGSVPLGYEALGGLNEHLLADIGAPELVRERARHCRDLQRQRVIDLELGHRSIGEGRW